MVVVWIPEQPEKHVRWVSCPEHGGPQLLCAASPRRPAQASFTWSPSQPPQWKCAGIRRACRKEGHGLLYLLLAPLGFYLTHFVLHVGGLLSIKSWPSVAHKIEPSVFVRSKRQMLPDYVFLISCPQLVKTFSVMHMHVWSQPQGPAPWRKWTAGGTYAQSRRIIWWRPKGLPMPVTIGRQCLVFLSWVLLSDPC